MIAGVSKVFLGRRFIESQAKRLQKLTKKHRVAANQTVFPSSLVHITHEAWRVGCVTFGVVRSPKLRQ